MAAGVVVSPDDLARGVDAKCLGAVGRQRIVDGRVGAVVEEAVVHASDAVIPDDLARVLMPYAKVWPVPAGTSRGV